MPTYFSEVPNKNFYKCPTNGNRAETDRMASMKKADGRFARTPGKNNNILR